MGQLVLDSLKTQSQGQSQLSAGLRESLNYHFYRKVR